MRLNQPLTFLRALLEVLLKIIHLIRCNKYQLILSRNRVCLIKAQLSTNNPITNPSKRHITILKVASMEEIRGISTF